MAYKNKIIDNIQELNENEKNLLKFIYNCNKKNGYCSTFTETFLSALNLSIEEYKEALKTLVILNLVHIEYYNTFRYILINEFALNHYKYLSENNIVIEEDFSNNSCLV